MDSKSGGQKRTPKMAVKSGPQKWWLKVDPKSCGKKRTPKRGQKWTPKVVVKK